MFDYLIWALAVIALASVVGILLMFLAKREQGQATGFYITMLMTLIMCFFNILAQPSNYLIQRLLGWFLLICAVVSIFLWIKNKQGAGKLLVLFAMLGAWVQWLFLF